MLGGDRPLNKTRRIVLAILFVALLAIVLLEGRGWWERYRRWDAIDTCLDAGGRWDYQLNVCEGARR